MTLYDEFALTDFYIHNTLTCFMHIYFFFADTSLT